MGAKKTLIVCGSIWVVATIATGFISGLTSLVLARLLLGIGEGAALPAQARAIANWFQRKDRGFVQGITHSFSRSRQCRGAAGGGVADRLAFVARGVRDCRGADFSVDSGLDFLLQR